MIGDDGINTLGELKYEKERDRLTYKETDT